MLAAGKPLVNANKQLKRNNKATLSTEKLEVALHWCFLYSVDNPVKLVNQDT